MMSHFVCADEPGHPMNQSQLALFSEIRKEFPHLPASLANSAGIHLGADAHFDLVRPGIALYGAEFIRNKPPLSTVVTAEARIMQVHDAARGDTVGYGAGKRLAEDARIAILSAGYADGYHRLAGSSDVRNGASVSVRGRTAPIMGRVSMDLIAVDVTGIPGAAEGDWAELFGASVPIDAAARAADTVGYEFLVQLSRRAERVYVTAILSQRETVSPKARGEGGCDGEDRPSTIASTHPPASRAPSPYGRREALMARTARTQYVCANCGAVSSKWQGRCDSCGEWNTLHRGSRRLARRSRCAPGAAGPSSSRRSPARRRSCRAR